MKHTFPLSLLSVALVSSLNAGDLTLKPIEITSTAIATDELKATDAVEIYTQEDIHKAHVQTIYEFLTTQTSLFATSAYGNPYSQKIDMRGYGIGDGYQNIVVTINGRRMNNVDMTAQILASISPSSIEKIEIIKSSGVVNAGDGTNAGVINITTKKSNEKEISFYKGNYGLHDASFFVGSHDEKLSVSVNAEVQRNQGIRDIDLEENKDANSLATAAFDLAYKASQNLELRLGAMLTKTDVIYPGPMQEREYREDPTQVGSDTWGPSNYAIQKYDTDVATTGLSYKINAKLSLDFDASNEVKKSLYTIPTYIYGATTNYDYKQLKTSLNYNDEKFALKFGAEAFYADLDYKNSYSTELSMQKDNEALFAISEFYFNALTLKAGYRYENIRFNESGGESANEYLYGTELGASYLLNQKSSLFANYSHAYQSASLDRMFSYFGTGYMGYVKPSQSNNYNLGYANIQTNNKLKLSLFYIDLKDEIYYYNDPTYMNSKNTNIDASYKYGVDIYDKYIFNQGLNLALNYNYVEAIIDKEYQNGEIYDGKKLPGVANHNLKVIVNYLPNEVTTLSLIEVYRSNAYAAEDFANDFTQKQDPFYATDIVCTYAQKGWEIFARVNNLFNQKNGIWIRDNAIYPVNYTTTAYAGIKLTY